MEQIKQNFSSREELLQKVPQRYIFGRSVFNIYLNDLLYLTDSSEVCNLAQDTTFLPVTKILTF